MNAECKIFVRLYLSKDGKWGGAETIQAVSELEAVNVVIFYEMGPCYASLNASYNRTACIAYRLANQADGPNGTRNHYDSVCDMDSTALYKAAQAIEK